MEDWENLEDEIFFEDEDELVLPNAPAPGVIREYAQERGKEREQVVLWIKEQRKLTVKSEGAQGGDFTVINSLDGNGSGAFSKNGDNSALNQLFSVQDLNKNDEGAPNKTALTGASSTDAEGIASEVASRCSSGANTSIYSEASRVNFDDKKHILHSESARGSSETIAGGNIVSESDPTDKGTGVDFKENKGNFRASIDHSDGEHAGDSIKMGAARGEVGKTASFNFKENKGDFVAETAAFDSLCMENELSEKRGSEAGVTSGAMGTVNGTAGAVNGNGMGDATNSADGTTNSADGAVNSMADTTNSASGVSSASEKAPFATDFEPNGVGFRAETAFSDGERASNDLRANNGAKRGAGCSATGKRTSFEFNENKDDFSAKATVMDIMPKEDGFCANSGGAPDRASASEGGLPCNLNEERSISGKKSAVTSSEGTGSDYKTRASIIITPTQVSKSEIDEVDCGANRGVLSGSKAIFEENSKGGGFGSKIGANSAHRVYITRGRGTSGEEASLRARNYIEESEIPRVEGNVVSVNICHISPNPNQPRKDFDEGAIRRLADSIRQYGIIQPITVRKCATGYEIISGERRFRAALELGLSHVPCIVSNVTEEKSAEMSIIENLIREDLNIFEQAESIETLIEIYGLTQEQVAEKLSSSQSFIANKLRLLRLTREEREMILANKLSERHARALLRVPNHEKRRSLLQVIIGHKLNVAQAEELIEESIGNAPKEKGQRTRFKDSAAFCASLSRSIERLRENGVAVSSKTVEGDEFTEITILLPKKG